MYAKVIDFSNLKGINKHKKNDKKDNIEHLCNLVLLKGKIDFSLNSENKKDYNPYNIDIEFFKELNTKIFNYCENNYISTSSYSGIYLSQSVNFCYKGNKFILKKVYLEDSIQVTFSTSTENNDDNFIDLEYVFKNKKPKNYTDLKNNFILNELNTLAIVNDVDLKYIKDLLNKKEI